VKNSSEEKKKREEFDLKLAQKFLKVCFVQNVSNSLSNSKNTLSRLIYIVTNF